VPQPFAPLGGRLAAALTQARLLAVAQLGTLFVRVSPSVGRDGLSHHKRLFNGTKPIFVENKGTLEEQTQTKPISQALGFGLSY
jgi:hypothetical protein